MLVYFYQAIVARALLVMNLSTTCLVPMECGMCDALTAKG
jgi:hypothetical protein